MDWRFVFELRIFNLSNFGDTIRTKLIQKGSGANGNTRAETVHGATKARGEI